MYYSVKLILYGNELPLILSSFVTNFPNNSMPSAFKSNVRKIFLGRYKCANEVSYSRHKRFRLPTEAETIKLLRSMIKEFPFLKTRKSCSFNFICSGSTTSRRLSLGLPLRHGGQTSFESSDDDQKNPSGSPTSPTAAPVIPAAAGSSTRWVYLSFEPVTSHIDQLGKLKDKTSDHVANIIFKFTSSINLLLQ